VVDSCRTGRVSVNEGAGTAAAATRREQVGILGGIFFFFFLVVGKLRRGLVRSYQWRIGELLWLAVCPSVMVVIGWVAVLMSWSWSWS